MNEPYGLKKQPFFIYENPKFPHVYISFSDAFIIVYIAWNRRMISECLFGKNLEESGRSLIDVLSQYSSGGTDMIFKKYSDMFSQFDKPY
jgi:hypothetical protein